VVGTKGSVVCEPAFEYAEGLGYELTVGEKTRRKKFSKSDQFAPELIHFAKCLRSGRKPEPSGKEGLIDVAIIEAIHRSIRSGAWEPIGVDHTKVNRPSLEQEIRSPPVAREPEIVDAESAHS
jgi:glucose-fructose oxidoreductase